MMNKENAAQRERAHLITLVKIIKPAAIAAGYDYPTDAPEKATNKELRAFIEDVTFFIRSRNGEV